MLFLIDNNRQAWLQLRLLSTTICWSRFLENLIETIKWHVTMSIYALFAFVAQALVYLVVKSRYGFPPFCLLNKLYFGRAVHWMLGQDKNRRTKCSKRDRRLLTVLIVSLVSKSVHSRRWHVYPCRGRERTCFIRERWLCQENSRRS